MCVLGVYEKLGKGNTAGTWKTEIACSSSPGALRAEPGDSHPIINE
jgi:hypothetical protein